MQIKRYYHPYEWKYMDKVVNDGMVAIIIAPTYGSGWFTWYGKEEMLYDPVVVDLIQKNNNPDLWDHNEIHDQFTDHIKEKYGIDDYFNIDDLALEWVEEGEEFFVDEYDGAESVRFRDHFKWMKA